MIIIYPLIAFLHAVAVAVKTSAVAVAFKTRSVIKITLTFYKVKNKMKDNEVTLDCYKTQCWYNTYRITDLTYCNLKHITIGPDNNKLTEKQTNLAICLNYEKQQC